MDKKIFDISSQNLYVVGCHGCAPRALLSGEENLKTKRFFIVPDNIMIVYFNSNGVQSEGSKNIPFLKNLYDYNKPMLNYIFDPSNYEINLNKEDPKSYRHRDFFKSLPFFSNFNYLCNFELYPPGVHCPNVHLSFTMSESSDKRSYFEGITPLENINFQNYGEPLNFIDTNKVHNPIIYLNKAGGFIYTDNLMEILKKKFTLNSGVFFISSCRAEYFTNKSNGNDTLVNLHPITRNCKDINYDIEFIDNLINEYPNSKLSLNGVKDRLKARDTAKKLIYKEIINKYLQYEIFWQNNFINELYKLFNVNDINICVNFKKIQINKNQEESINKHVDKIFLEIRKYLIRKYLMRQLYENDNYVLYRKIRYLQNLTLYYLTYNKQLPSDDIFKKFNDDVEKIPITTTEYDECLVLHNILQKYNKKRKRENFKKYLKYKQKYLKLKNKLN